MKDNELLISILKDQVVPALGCTEPTAVAYATAKAKEILGEEVLHLDIYADKNILKNGKEVGIPGTKEKGNVVAAALALIVGKSEYKLEVLKEVTDNSLTEALKLIDKDMITLNHKKDVIGLYIEIVAKGANNTSRVVIQKTHLNITLLEKNGECISESKEEEPTAVKPALRDRIKEFTIADLKEFVDTVEFEKIAFINEGILMNKRMAFAGLNENLGIGLGNMLNTDEKDYAKYAKAITAAASEARMAGHPLPVMSSAGSGNHGLVAILPVAIIGEGMKLDQEKIIRGVALSHLVTIYIKTYTGSLSPVCGCGVAAGVGASAGLAYIYGGTLTQIEGAIKNMIAGVTGMICDGAKLGCAYKLSVSVSSCVDAAKMAMDNIFVPSNDGILDKSAEKSIQNMGKVSSEGMSNTDDVILDVMMAKCN
ncbi:MAG: serine dehydratase subunit alpha family protein [Solirubrobacterales bacterium]